MELNIVVLEVYKTQAKKENTEEQCNGILIFNIPVTHLWILKGNLII